MNKQDVSSLLSRITILVLIIALSSLLMAACGSGSESSETGGTEAEQDIQTSGDTGSDGAGSDSITEPIHIRAGINSSNQDMLTQIAFDKGLFDEEGVDVEIVQFSSTSDGIAAMEAGKLDVSYSFGSNSPLQYISSGSEITFYGGYFSNGHPIVTLPENADQYDSSTREGQSASAQSCCSALWS